MFGLFKKEATGVARAAKGPLPHPAGAGTSRTPARLVTTDEDHALGESVILSRLEDAVGWGRKYSLFNYPFVTACCGMEFMSVAAGHNDLDRFGAAFPRFTPRQADLLMVVGTINHKISPVLKKVYEQMCEPKWVISFGTCASTGGFYDNYATVQGIDTIIPVDVYIAGCPPPPESVFDAIMKLQDRIQVQGLDVLSSAQRQRDRVLAASAAPRPGEAGAVPPPAGLAKAG